MKTRLLFYSILSALSLFLYSSCKDNQTKQDLLRYRQSDVRAFEIAEIVKRSFLLDDLNMDAYNELLEPSYRIYMGSSKEPIKFSAITPFIFNVYYSFPDYNHTINNIVATEDYILSTKICIS